MSKRKKANSGDYSGDRTSSIILLVLFLAFIYICSFYGWRYSQNIKIEADRLKEYDAILRNARDLLLRYKNISVQAQSNNDIHDRTTHTIKNGIRTNNAHQGVPTKPEKLQHTKSNLEANPNFPISASHVHSSPGGIKKDIVVGMAQDTDPKNFAVFCGSLRKVSTADVIIFVNVPVSDRLTEIATKHSIRIIGFDLTSIPESIRKYHPSTLRWPLFYNFFKDEHMQSIYGRVWMIDVRDSFFQSDPFLMLPAGQSAFYVFAGVEDKNIAACGWNGGWVRDCFGENSMETNGPNILINLDTDIILREIGHKNIICSGVSVASMDTAIIYLKLMNDIVLGKKNDDASLTARFPACERNGVDQGTHNVLVHKNLIPQLKLWSQRNGPVANLQARLARVENMRVYNAINELVAVVHQYDRYPALQALLFAEYVYWTNTGDVMSEWNEDVSCKPFSYRKHRDLFKAQCDLKHRSGTSPASCCSMCTQTKGCDGFTFAGGLCYLKSCNQPVSDVPMEGAFSAFRSK
eukprot:gene697-1336_t